MKSDSACGFVMPAALLCGIFAYSLSAVPAEAGVVINPIFDSSITSLSNASQVENAFNSVAADYSRSFGNSLTVNVQVSWGSVHGSSLPSSAVGASSDPLYGYFSYNQIRSYLTDFSKRNPADTALATAVKYLPIYAPAGPTNYVLPSSEAKALGVISGSNRAIDGYIGFAGSTANYDFEPSNGVSMGTFDFKAVAAHELGEVLGRISGLESANFRSPLDLFRYSAPGQLSFDYNQAAYFSIDGGKTVLGNFNNAALGGDRSDWLTLNASADIQDAFISTGRNYNLSAVDLTVLDVLGWGGSNMGDTSVATPNGVAFALVEEVPEPLTIAIFAVGLMGLWLAKRRLADDQQAAKQIAIPVIVSI